MVERQPSKLNVDGSSPFTRFPQASRCICSRRPAVVLWRAYFSTQVPLVLVGMMTFTTS